MPILKSKSVLLAAFLSICFQAILSDAASAEGLKSDSQKMAAVVFPVLSTRLTSKFGMRRHPITKGIRHHDGIDLAAPTGTDVRAIRDGIVVFTGRYQGYGNLVTIKHADGYTSLYGHLRKFSVKTGQHVCAGQLLGEVGSTGIATGPHLHFEWRQNNKSLDPIKIFPGFTASAKG